MTQPRKDDIVHFRSEDRDFFFESDGSRCVNMIGCSHCTPGKKCENLPKCYVVGNTEEDPDIVLAIKLLPAQEHMGHGNISTLEGEAILQGKKREIVDWRPLWRIENMEKP